MSPRVQDLSHPCLLTEVEQRFRKLLFFFFKMAITASFVRPKEDIRSPLTQNTCAHTHTIIMGSPSDPSVSALRAARARGGSAWSAVV